MPSSGRRMESLLGQGSGEPEAVREDHPDGSWRADALGTSRHARLSDHIREPLDVRDQQKAEEICAEACRNLLRDFAPGLAMLPLVERQRCQALATYARTLFDFAGQSGVEGERLAALNRVEFTLEEALEGKSVGQPSFLRMAAAEAERPWNREALDELVGIARRRVLAPRPHTAEEAEAQGTDLARAIATALLPVAPDPAVVRLGGALSRLHSLTTLGEDLRRGRARLPIEELPSPGEPGRAIGREIIDRAVRSESGRLRSVLEESAAVGRHLPPGWRRCVAFARLAGLGILGQVEQLGWQLTSQPPRLGAAQRIGLVLRARCGAR